MFIDSTSTHINHEPADVRLLHATNVLSLGVRTQDAPVCPSGGDMIAFVSEYTRLVVLGCPKRHSHTLRLALSLKRSRPLGFTILCKFERQYEKYESFAKLFREYTRKWFLKN